MFKQLKENEKLNGESDSIFDSTESRNNEKKKNFSNKVEPIEDESEETESFSTKWQLKRRNDLDIFHGMKPIIENDSMAMSNKEESQLDKFDTKNEIPKHKFEQIHISEVVRERLNSLTKDISRRTSVIKQNSFKLNTYQDSDSFIYRNDDNEETIKDIRSLNSYVDDLAPSPFSVFTILDKKALVPLKSILKATFCDNVERHWQNFQPFKIIPCYVSPESHKYLLWLTFLSCCFLYNAIVIPLRATFPYQTSNNLAYWMIFDYFCDIIYVMDMVIVKSRLSFLSHGTYTKNSKQMWKRYFYGIQFKIDLLSVIPLDLMYFNSDIGPNVLLRLNRLFKFLCYHELINNLDRIVDHPYLVRIMRTIGYLIYSIHLNSCLFYAISRWEGLGSTKWTYNGQGNAYLRCFYLATQFATVCGEIPDPTNVIEMFHTLISWLVGVFITVILLGQIKDIAAKARKNNVEFRDAEDKVLGFCKDSNVPDYVQQKVRDYFYYLWQQQRTLDESKVLNGLSRKLHIDLAISVHYETLRKAQIFQNCEKAFLRSLVAKLKPIICMPGSYVCKKVIMRPSFKGERITEMFIVDKGILLVQNDARLLATLIEGSVFGEAGLLMQDNSMRRMVDVVSKGYSNLFILQKDDLKIILEDYPDEMNTIKKLTRKFFIKPTMEINMEQISKLSVFPPTPKLFQTVLDISSKAGRTGILENLQKADMNRRESKTSKNERVFDCDSLSSDFSIS